MQKVKHNFCKSSISNAGHFLQELSYRKQTARQEITRF